MESGGLWQISRFKEDQIDLPLVSIITVTFNADQHLAQALDSILCQTYSNIELIVIDGESTDSTLDLIRERADRIDYWISEADSGIYDAMNKGIELARGQFLGFKNADDWYLPNAVEMMVQASRNIGADVLYGNSLSILEEEPLQVAPFFTDHKTLGQNPGIDHRSCFMRSSLHKSILFDLKYKLAADLDVFYRLQNLSAKFVHIDGFLSYKRFGGASDGTAILKESFEINRKYKGWVWAKYAQLKSRAIYFKWRLGNAVLKSILSAEVYHNFKSRKIS